MILSVHVPRTGGNSFREMLAASYGDRLLRDYGDWAGCRVPEAIERCRERTRVMRARCEEIDTRYDVIHGHFAPDKYLGLFPREDCVGFFRDPYQQTVSHYHFLRRNPQREHIEAKLFHDGGGMTLRDYIRWEAFRDHQTQYLGSLAIEDFAMVGIAESFKKSVALYGAMFGRTLCGPCPLLNGNGPDGYLIGAGLRALVAKYRAADVELYRRACECHAAQLRVFGL